MHTYNVYFILSHKIFANLFAHNNIHNFVHINTIKLNRFMRFGARYCLCRVCASSSKGFGSRITTASSWNRTTISSSSRPPEVALVSHAVLSHRPHIHVRVVVRTLLCLSHQLLYTR